MESLWPKSPLLRSAEVLVFPARAGFLGFGHKATANRSGQEFCLSPSLFLKEISLCLSLVEPNIIWFSSVPKQKMPGCSLEMWLSGECGLWESMDFSQSLVCGQQGLGLCGMNLADVGSQAGDMLLVILLQKSAVFCAQPVFSNSSKQ